MKIKMEKNTILISIAVGFGIVLLINCMALGYFLRRNKETVKSIKQEYQQIKLEAAIKNEELQTEINRIERAPDQSEIYKRTEEQEISEQSEEAMIVPPKGKSNSFDVNLETVEAGTILSAEEVIANKDNYFSAFDIIEGDTVYNRIIGKSYQENENVGLADLKYLKMVHYNFDHQIQMGEMIVNVAIYEDVLNVFKELFDMEYEVQSMYLVDNYWTGNGGLTDSASIDVNNTSSFNYRPITGGSKLSNHAYGRAIDINPQQNPYVINGDCSHENATPYIDRSCGDPHVIVVGDVCYNVFRKYGFIWGGEWENPKDYQHFEKSENASY